MSSAIAATITTLRSKLTKAAAAIAADVEALRERIATKRSELRQATEAPVPIPEAMGRAHEVVARVGATWLKEHGHQLLRYHREDLRVFRGLASPSARGRVQLPDMNRDPWGLLCAADPARAEDLLGALLARLAYVPGTSSLERPAELARLEGELEELESGEELLIDEANAAGLSIDHRADVATRRRRQEANRQAAAEAAKEQEARQTALDAKHEAYLGKRRFTVDVDAEAKGSVAGDNGDGGRA